MCTSGWLFSIEYRVYRVSHGKMYLFNYLWEIEMCKLDFCLKVVLKPCMTSIIMTLLRAISDNTVCHDWPCSKEYIQAVKKARLFFILNAINVLVVVVSSHLGYWIQIHEVATSELKPILAVTIIFSTIFWIFLINIVAQGFILCAQMTCNLMKSTGGLFLDSRKTKAILKNTVRFIKRTKRTSELLSPIYFHLSIIGKEVCNRAVTYQPALAWKSGKSISCPDFHHVRFLIFWESPALCDYFILFVYYSRVGSITNLLIYRWIFPTNLPYVPTHRFWIQPIVSPCVNIC